MSDNRVLFEIVPIAAGELDGLWPIHPRPLPGETALSWLTRLALAYGRSLKEFDEDVLGSAIVNRADRSTWRPRIVFDPSRLEQALPKLARGVGVEIAELRELFFPPVEDHDLFLVPGGPQCVCPQCWKNDKQPYFRRRWKLITAAACTEHGVKLLLRCPRCHVDIRDDSVRHDRDHLAFCRSCGDDLRQLPIYPADPDVVAFCREVERVCERWSEPRSQEAKLLDRTLVALIKLVWCWGGSPTRIFGELSARLPQSTPSFQGVSALLPRFDPDLLHGWLRHVRSCMFHRGADWKFQTSDVKALEADLTQFSTTECCLPPKAGSSHRIADVLAVAFHLWRMPEQRLALSRMFCLEPRSPDLGGEWPRSKSCWLGWDEPFLPPRAPRQEVIVRDVPLPPLVIKAARPLHGDDDNWVAKYCDPRILPIVEKMMEKKWAYLNAAPPALQRRLVQMMARRLVDRAEVSAAADIFNPRF